MKSSLIAQLRLTPDQAIREQAADRLQRLERENRELRQTVQRLRGAVGGAMAHLKAVGK